MPLRAMAAPGRGRLRIVLALLPAPILVIALEYFRAAGRPIGYPGMLLLIPVVYAALSGGFVCGTAAALIGLLYPVHLLLRTGNSVDFDLTLVYSVASASILMLARSLILRELRYQQIEANRSRDARFRNIVNVANDAIISINTKQVITDFNHGAEIIFGYRAGEVIGQRLDVLLPDRYRAAHAVHVDRFGASGVEARPMAERSEISGRRRNGEEFPAEASISRVEIEGEIIYTVVLRDITLRRRLEKMQTLLADAGSRMTTIHKQEALDTAAEIAIPAFADWCVLFVGDVPEGVRFGAAAHRDDHEAASLRARLAGTHFSEGCGVIGRLVEAGEPRLLGPEDLAEDPLLGRMSLVFLRSALFVPVPSARARTGAAFFFSATRHFDNADLSLATELVRRAALAIDNARLYHMAQVAMRAREDVLAVVSHDLGNPLSAIRIGTTLLLARLSEEEKASGGWKHLDGIRKSAQQMESLIRDLLEARRVESGSLSVSPDYVSVRDALEECMLVHEPIAQEKGISLTLNCTARQVYADRERLLQALGNLVGNAFKFTAAGGEVRLTATPQEDRTVLFSVSDTGNGLSPEQCEHVFDRYWQAKKEHRKNGIGLGLSIVKGVVEAQGGRVWVESQEGEGTTFFFTLPAVRPPTVNPQRESSVSALESARRCE